MNLCGPSLYTSLGALIIGANVIGRSVGFQAEQIALCCNSTHTHISPTHLSHMDLHTHLPCTFTHPSHMDLPHIPVHLHTSLTHGPSHTSPVHLHAHPLCTFTHIPHAPSHTPRAPSHASPMHLHTHSQCTFTPSPTCTPHTQTPFPPSQWPLEVWPVLVRANASTSTHPRGQQGPLLPGQQQETCPLWCAGPPHGESRNSCHDNTLNE